MSLIEQTPKLYNPRKQDHGDAAEQKGIHRASNDIEEELKKIAKSEDAYFRDALAELTVDYNSKPDELEAAADYLLDASVPHTTTSERFIPSTDTAPYDYETEDEEGSDTELDYNRTVSDVEVGLDSLTAIKAEKERRATLDSYEDDDLGDRQYDSPMHVFRPRIPKV